MFLDNNPLDAEDTTSLLAILRYLRNERRITYTKIADQMSLDVADIFSVTSQRGRGSADLFEKIKKFCKTRDIDYNRIIENNKIGSKFLITEIGINEEIVVNSEKEMTGTYLLFSAGSNAHRAVTFLEFLESDKTPLSRFQAWRPRKNATDLRYGGFYHKYSDTVFMYGHIEGSPLSRSIMLVPLISENDQFIWRGFMVGASETDMLFLASCVMQRVKSIDQVEELLGDFSYSIFNTKFPEIENALRSTMETKSFTRAGG